MKWEWIRVRKQKEEWKMEEPELQKKLFFRREKHLHEI